jgi:hypothetical protein
VVSEYFQAAVRVSAMHQLSHYISRPLSSRTTHITVSGMSDELQSLVLEHILLCNGWYMCLCYLLQQINLVLP